MNIYDLWNIYLRYNLQILNYLSFQKSPLPSVVTSMHDTSHPYHQQVTFQTTKYSLFILTRKTPTKVEIGPIKSESIYFKLMLIIDYGVIS